MQYDYICVGDELLNNRAMLLPAVNKKFNEELEQLSKLAGQTCPEIVIAARWLLNKTAHALGHHIAYTCVLRKHGTMLHHSGKELHAPSHSLQNAKYCPVYCSERHASMQASRIK